MDVRVLRYFLAVAQEQSMTKAAELLHTTQPNLSRQLNELEESLGKKLFIRESRKIRLTEEGMFLRKRAKEIVELVDRTETDLSAFDEAVSGVVHIGAVETHVMRFLGDAMLELKSIHPEVSYNLYSESIAEITDGLNKGLLDFGVVVAPVDMEQYDYIKLPQNDRFGLIMRKDCPLAELPAIRPDDIKDYPVWVAHQQLEANALAGWLGRDMSTLNIVSTFNLITTPAMLVEQGFGMAFTFDKLANTGPDSPLCFRPLEPTVEGDIYLVWKKYQMFSRPAKVFLEQVQKKMIELQSSEA